MINSAKLKWMFLFGIAVAVTTFYSNCQPPPPGQISNFGLPAKVAGVQNTPIESPNEIPFAKSKVDIQGFVTSQSQQKISSDTLPLGTRLHFILDNQCLSQGLGQQFAKAAASSTQMLTSLPRQSYSLHLSQEITLGEFTSMIHADPCIVGVSHDIPASTTETLGFSPNDPHYSSQKNMHSIRLGQAHNFFQGGYRGANTNVLVAVVDSGIDYTHEDLQLQILNKANNTPEGGEKFEANKTFPDDDPMDDLGHGTKVAGIIGATMNNGVGISGVFGTTKLKMIPIKVTDEQGSTFFTDVAWGVDLARAKGADVINISISGNTPTASAALAQSILDAVNAGVVVVFAAGNNGVEVTDSKPYVPCYYGKPNAGALCVGSIDANSLDRSSFSNWSSSYVEISAPGSGGVYSTMKNNTYQDDMGTSFSAPQVTGAAALIISFFKTNGIQYTPAMVENILKDSSLHYNSLTGSVQQGQVLDLRNLADYLQQVYLTPLAGGISDEL